MNSKLFTLASHDFFKGAVTAVLAAIVISLNGVVTQGDFNVFSTDWSMVLSDVIKVSSAAFIGYLGKNLLTNEEGKIAGI